MTKPMLLLMGLLSIGLYQNWELVGDFFDPQASSTMRQGNVVLYATQWCSYCAKTRKFFAKKHIAYKELDVENSEQGRIGYEQLGGGGIPIIVVNESTVIRGYDPGAIIKALGRTP